MYVSTVRVRLASSVRASRWTLMHGSLDPALQKKRHALLGALAMAKLLHGVHGPARALSGSFLLLFSLVFVAFPARHALCAAPQKLHTFLPEHRQWRALYGERGSLPGLGAM